MMQVKVLVDGQEKSVVPTAGDLVRLEREYGVAASKLDEENVTIEHVLFLSWCSLRRTGAVPREMTFDEFLDVADTPGGGVLDDPPPPPPPPS